MLDDKALDLLFRTARTHNGWLPRPVTDAQIRAIYEIVKMGPTSVIITGRSRSRSTGFRSRP